MGVRTWLLRRAMGRLRISDDIVRHLSTFQRLGETVEVQLPTEVLPIGARTLLRALRPARGSHQEFLSQNFSHGRPLRSGNTVLCG